MLRSLRLRRLFKEGGWIVFGQIMVVFGTLVFVRLLTELLSPSAYGELALGITLATFVNQVLLGPLSGGVMRFYAPATEQGDLGGYFSAVKKLVIYASLGMITVTAVAILTLASLGELQWLPITLTAILFATFSGYGANISGIQTAARQRSIVAVHQAIEPLLRALIAGGLILWLGVTSSVAMIGYSLTSFLVLVSQIYFFQKHYHYKYNAVTQKDWQDKIWRFSWPISLFGIFTWIQLVSDRWALGLFSSTGDIGHYAVLYQLGYYPISLLTGMGMQFLVPILYQRAGDASDYRRNNDATKLSWQLVWVALGMTMIAFIITIIFHERLFQILVAEEYRSISSLLPWLILSSGLFSAGQSLASNLQAKLKTREMMTAKIVTALLGVVFNLIGAYWYGISGIVCAGILFSMTYLMWMVVLVNRRD